MSKLLELNGYNGKIAIVVNRITGICTVDTAGCKSFIATGADGADGGENGFYCTDDFDTVTIKLESLLGLNS